MAFYVKTIGELGSELFFHLLDEMKKHDIITNLQAIKTPALVITGDRDNVVPSALQGILLDNLPQAELYIVRNGSHVPQMDFPDMINERINFFFRCQVPF